MSRYHKWTVSMVKDLAARERGGATMEQLLQYAKETYGFTSTLSAITTALTRYAATMYQVAPDGSGKITWVNRLPKERDSRYGGLSEECADFLRKARAAAIRAVAVYNTPTLDEEEDFRSANYIVLMIIAWTAIFHAIFLKKGIRPFRDEASGEMWEVRECLRQHFGPDNPPERFNLQLLTELRDRIEHRHLPALDEEIFGECQACLTNFEALLVREFGDQFALNARLAFALQFGETLQAGQVHAIRASQRKRAGDVLKFITEFRGRLTDQVLADQRFALRVYIIPKVGSRPSSSDAAVEFIKFDPDDPAHMEKYDQFKALIRDRHVPVANKGMLKPGRVAEAVAEGIRCRFTVSEHTLCWRQYQVRPSAHAVDLTATKQEYCVWDEPNQSYLYTPAWVRFLIEKMRDPDEYRRVIGKDQKIAAPAPGAVSNAR